MNNVSLIGRLTADPELRHTQSDLAMTRFSIAVDRSYTKPGEDRQTDFINLIAWRQTAEFICKYFTKGQRIGITGEIRTGSYTDKNGNKRTSFDVVVNNAYFCESRNSSGSYGNYSGQTSRRQSEPAEAAYSSGEPSEFDGMPGDDDLPF